MRHPGRGEERGSVVPEHFTADSHSTSRGFAPDKKGEDDASMCVRR